MSYQSPIHKANEDVPTLDLARRLCPDLHRAGAEYKASCPLPDHEDRSPSFYVNPQRNVWFCHGCGIGGDVVRLAQLAWGYPANESHIAAAELLMMFGHEVPQRPSSWLRKFERQRPIHDAIGKARFDHLRRRLYRAFFEPSVLAIEDAAEREDEKRILWEATEPLARMLVRDLAGRRPS